MEKEIIARFMEEHVAFCRFLGMRLTDGGPGWVEMRLPFRPEFMGDPLRPALHGGLVTTLIDTAGGAAAMTEMETSDRISTIDIRVDYLRPGEPKDLVVRATVLRQGNRVAVVGATAHQGDATKPIADGRAVYSLRRQDEMRG
ncbi:MAG: PaaI family thioesterase [Planctomycetes bacterium]|nr:PaaI family thioesterase [Planctomycetota bacterium]